MNITAEQKLNTVRMELTRQSHLLSTVRVECPFEKLVEAAQRAELLVDQARRILFDAVS